MNEMIQKEIKNGIKMKIHSYGLFDPNDLDDFSSLQGFQIT